MTGVRLLMSVGSEVTSATGAGLTNSSSSVRSISIL